MPTDRKWMWDRFSSDGGFRQEFVQNVEAFLQLAIENSKTDGSGGKIKCPCSSCGNRYFRGAKTVKKHIYRKGFTKNYTQWIFHGEPYGSMTGETSNLESISVNPNPYVQMVFDGVGPHLDDNHHDDADQNPSPTHEMPSNFDAANFNSLLEDANTPLWSGCKSHTVISAMSRMLNHKCEGQISVHLFDEQIRLMKEMLPEDNKLPNNFYQFKKKMGKLGLGYVKIDSCINNCMIYYKEDMHLTECRFCHHSRYKVAPSGGKKGIPHSILRYLPITPRLERLYSSIKTAPHMTWHHRNQSVDGTMAHPSDSEAWKHFNSIHKDFASEPRNVRLGLCTDGFTPFNHYGQSYSCWPVILTVYNLPPWMCMKEPYMFLNMIIPGPSHPGKDIDVFLRPLIDELNDLWCTGVRAFDASRRAHFKLRAALLWTISDLPAYAMLSGWGTQGKLACPYCMELSNAIWLKNGRKCSHFDCHRRFLKMTHPFREEKDDFRKGVVVREGPPPILSGDQLFERVSTLPSVTFGKQHKDEQIGGYGQIHNWRKRSIFWELPYWRTLLIRHNLDVMHVEKNVFENIFNIVMDVKDKTKDNAKARADLAIICNRLRAILLER